MTRRRVRLAITAIMVGAISCGSIINIQAQSVQELSFQEHKPVKDLGTVGAVFPIIERHIIDVLKDKLQSEQGRALLKDFEKRLKNVVANEAYLPKSVLTITPTPEHTSYLFNPTVSFAQDVSDHKGTRFYKAGETVNPLDHITLSKDYLFIDGDRPKQIEWAKGYQQQKKAMIILVKGNPFAVMKDHGLQVFFDQEGAMVQRFKLRHVPCSMKQAGKSLRITEWVEDELVAALEEQKP